MRNDQSASGALFIEGLASRKVWDLRDSQAMTSHWKDENTSGSWGLGGTYLEVPIRYLVEVEFVPGVQG